MSEPKVKILVSCHKPIVMPRADVFLPVHVGAKNASRTLPGMQPDDEGENISDRNFTFCELTAQYWAWKNLEADYVGQCHYRRYFTFGNDHRGLPVNDHKQIEADSLSPYALSDLHIDDQQLTIDTVSQYDLVVPPYWNVKGAETPAGPKKTIQEHMEGYGLIDSESFELLKEIVAERQPAYLDDLTEYLGGSQYLGYNCFVMKRAFFDRLCAFEFDVLLEFDRRFDYSRRSTTQKRICGYLGEVLFSVFVNKVRKEGGAKIGHYPLVFFLDTKPPLPLQPNIHDIGASAESGASDTVDIYWRFDQTSAPALAICIASLLEHVDPQKHYRISLLCEPDFESDFMQKLLPPIPANASIGQTAWQTVDCKVVDVSVSADEARFLTPLLLPWMRDDSSSIIWLDGMIAFQDDPAQLLAAAAGNAITCAHGILTERELNRPANRSFKSAYEQRCGTGDKHDPSVMVVNLALLRNNTTPQQIIGHWRDAWGYFGACEGEDLELYRTPAELPTITLAIQSAELEMLEAAHFSFDAVCQSIDPKETQAWALEENVRSWMKASNPSAVIYRPERIPYLQPDGDLGPLFWQHARKTRAYEPMLAEMAHRSQRRMLDILLPPGSTRRKKVGKLTSLLRR